MARDTRTYVRVNDGLPDNPKILDVGDLAGWLYVCGLCYCSRQLTDGVIPVAMVGRLTGLANFEALASALLEAKLWHAPGHICERCPQPLAGTYVVHDYLDHQRSAAEVRELSEKRAAAGQRGGKASGASRRGEANSEASATAKPKQPGSKNEADTDTDTDRRKDFSSPPAPPEDDAPHTSTKGKPKKPEPYREDVDKICHRLVDLMVANECKPPTITDDWRAEARRMFDIDNRAFDKAMALLEWSQQDSFWKKNIHSIPTFRAKYDQLRLAANDDWAKKRADGHGAEPTAPKRVPWCGHCDERTRRFEDADQPYHCPECGPYSPKQKASTL